MMEEKKLGHEWANKSLSHGTLQVDDIFFNIAPIVNLPRNYVNGFIQAEDQEEYLYEYIFPYLNCIAPDGYYFGAHEGNTSDFGFWEIPIEEDEREEEPPVEQLKVTRTMETIDAIPLMPLKDSSPWKAGRVTMVDRSPVKANRRKNRIDFKGKVLGDTTKTIIGGIMLAGMAYIFAVGMAAL